MMMTAASANDPLPMYDGLILCDIFSTSENYFLFDAPSNAIWLTPSKNNASVVLGMADFRLVHCLDSFHNKKSLIKHNASSRTNKTIRGTTLIYGKSRTLCRIQTYPSQLTYASRHGILGVLFAFDHALGGPFNSQHFDPALSFPDSLYAHLLLLSPLQRFSNYSVLENIHCREANVKKF